MSRVRGDTIIDATNLATESSYVLTLDGYPRLAIQATFSDATPSAKSFADTDVDILLDKIDYIGHGLSTGTKGRFTSTGTLPSPLATATDYWIIRRDADSFKVAASLADAVANSPITLNSLGTGTHTFTPTALSGGVLKGQASNDGTAFVDVPTLLAKIDSNGTAIFNVVEPAYRHLRVVYVPDSGTINLSVVLNAHDDLIGTYSLTG